MNLNFLRIFRERNRIKYLSKELYSQFSIIAPSIFDKENYKKYNELEKHWDNCLDELVTISYNLSVNRKIIDYFKKEKNDLKNIYQKIIDVNTAVEINSRYVAAYSILNPNTLYILLYQYSSDDFKIEDKSSISSLNIITQGLKHYFLKNYDPNPSIEIKRFITKYNL